MLICFIYHVVWFFISTKGAIHVLISRTESQFSSVHVRFT